MSTTLNENGVHADFTTGLVVPQGGVDSFATAATIIKDQSLQELADRTQWLKGWLATEPIINVPLNPMFNAASRFTATHTNWAVYWLQDSVASTGGLVFPIPGLVVGRKIKGVTAYWRNPGNTTLPVANMPAVALITRSIAVGSSPGNGTAVATQADTTAVSATYQASHAIAITGLSLTILADTEYAVRFTGESSTNAVNQGQLLGLRVTLGY